MPCWADNNGFIIYLSQKVNVDEFRQIIKVLKGKSVWIGIMDGAFLLVIFETCDTRYK